MLYTVVYETAAEGDRHSKSVDATSAAHAVSLVVPGYAVGIAVALTEDTVKPDFEWSDELSNEVPSEPANFGDGTDYNDWRKDALIAEASKRGLDSDGTRADIIERLEEHDAE